MKFRLNNIWNTSRTYTLTVKNRCLRPKHFSKSITQSILYGTRSFILWALVIYCGFNNHKNKYNINSKLVGIYIANNQK